MDNYIKETSIKGLYVIDRPMFEDERGFFREVFRLKDLEEVIGFKFNIVQSNHAHSKANVIRALHAENWNKLVYPVNGKMFAAVVDIREESGTFGKTETFNFDSSFRKALFIPKGLANSICVDGENSVDYIYYVDSYYDGNDTEAIAWDDPTLNINWPVKTPIISERDKNNPTLKEAFPEKFK
ncbi:MAG: dTDP-4-dehydrorhamnose 3,5-epimerase family protein [Patescibacteria group bacterium]